MNFGTFHGVSASKYKPGEKTLATYKGRKINVTVIEHNGRHGVKVRLENPILVVTTIITKRCIGRPTITEEEKWVSELSLYEADVEPNT